MSNSAWGYVATTLDAPSNVVSSPWGRARTTISAPAQPVNGSWARAVDIIRPPHAALGVITATGLAYVPVRVYDGAHWR